MDPMSALALAGNIIQFLEFGCKLIAKTSQIHQTGSVVEYAHLQVVATDLHRYTARLRSDVTTTNAPEFQDVLDGCLKVATEMLRAIQALEIPGKPNRWKSLRQAFKSILGKDRLTELKTQLDLYTQQMDRRMLMVIRERVDVATIRQTENYDCLDRSIQAAFERMSSLEKQGQEHMKEVQNIGQDIVSTIQSLVVDNRGSLNTTQQAITDLSDTFHQNNVEIAMLATECLSRLKSALIENRQYHQETLAVLEDSREQGRQQIEELKQEIDLLKVALRQSVQLIRGSDISPEEEKRIKDSNNSIYNLWIAKELVLRNTFQHLKTHVGDFGSILETVSSKIQLFSETNRQRNIDTKLDHWGTASEIVTEWSGIPEPSQISPPPYETLLSSFDSVMGYENALSSIQMPFEQDGLQNFESVESISGSDWASVPSSAIGSSSWAVMSSSQSLHADESTPSLVRRRDIARALPSRHLPTAAQRSLPYRTLPRPKYLL